MSSLFYIGNTSSGRQPPSTIKPVVEDKDHPQAQAQAQAHNNYLYRNQEIYNNSNSNNNKGFEIWPEYYQQHHLVGVGGNYSTFGVGPSRSRTLNFSSNSSDDSTRAGFLGSGGGFGGMNCQDCGNQAKKDCIHMRCRTCCKSRGYNCQTHVKSTWVPASKRRERQQHQQQQSSFQIINHQEQDDDDDDDDEDENPKRRLIRDHNVINQPPPTTTTSHSGLEVGCRFPSEVNSQAVFRCVRVHAVDDAEKQYAYQTAVNIGGHVFKGILYDQGGVGGQSSSSHGANNAAMQHLNLTTTTTPAASALLQDPSLYPAPLNAFIAGTQFFPPPRP